MEVRINNSTNENTNLVIDEHALTSLIKDLIGTTKSTDFARANEIVKTLANRAAERSQYWRNVDAKEAFRNNLEQAVTDCTNCVNIKDIEAQATTPVSTITEKESNMMEKNIFNPNAHNGTRESVNLINLSEMAEKAVANGKDIDTFVKEAIIAYVAEGGDITAIKGVEGDARGSYVAAMGRKKEAADKATYQQLHTLDRILIQLTESMIDFGDSAMAGLVQSLLTEKASKVKIAYEIGRNSNNKDMMNDLKYIINALKRETPTSGPWANKLIECYSEIYKK